MEKIVLKDAYTPDEVRENRAIWVRNLRSGEFPQGHGALRNQSGYCCLGVLAASCEGIEEVSTSWTSVDGVHVVCYHYIDGSSNEEDIAQQYSASAPKSAMEAVGLQKHAGSYLDPSTETGHNSLWGLNDAQKLPFDQIADVIESEPEGMFL